MISSKQPLNDAPKLPAQLKRACAEGHKNEQPQRHQQTIEFMVVHGSESPLVQQLHEQADRSGNPSPPVLIVSHSGHSNPQRGGELSLRQASRIANTYKFSSSHDSALFGVGLAETIGSFQRSADIADTAIVKIERIAVTGLQRLNPQVLLGNGFKFGIHGGSLWALLLGVLGGELLEAGAEGGHTANAAPGGSFVGAAGDACLEAGQEVSDRGDLCVEGFFGGVLGRGAHRVVSMRFGFTSSRYPANGRGQGAFENNSEFFCEAA